MLTIAAHVLMILGFVWVLDIHLGFQIEMAPYLYPFDMATRKILGIPLLLIGTFVEWLKTCQDRKKMLESV